MSQDHAFDFDLAGGIARRLAPGGRELIDKLVENSKKLTTPPVPQSGESTTGSDASNSLPIPKASASIAPSKTLDASLPSTLEDDQRTLNSPPELASNEAHNAANFEKHKADLIRQEAEQADSGTVIIRPPATGATPEQEAQIREYVALVNVAIAEGRMSIAGRMPTKGKLRLDANDAVRKERLRAAVAGTPYKGVAGHVPDTTWTGTAEPPFWMDMDSSINSSIGSQSQNYPIGYRPKRFIYEGDL